MTLINFFLFAVKRYARFCSYLAAFLAGFSFGLSSTLFWCGLAASIVLGSLSAYESRPGPGPGPGPGSGPGPGLERPAGRVRTDARPCAGADSAKDVSYE